ncbi:MAG TPA: hypothetical protein DCS83_04570 [Prevotella sp.]|nr:hypothetical protein [Prevotella sp.]
MLPTGNKSNSFYLNERKKTLKFIFYYKMKGLWMTKKCIIGFLYPIMKNISKLAGQEKCNSLYFCIFAK